MRILFDIVHPADVNFFKSAIYTLIQEGNKVFISFRYRGKLESILRFEYQGLEIHQIGFHQKGLVNKVVHQFIREFKVFSLVKRNKIDVVACFGAVSAIGARLAGARFIAFDDDYEYKIAFYQPNLLSNLHVYPESIPFRRKNVLTYRGYKELAYLHRKRPFLSNDTFMANQSYCFIRVISRISLNYQNEIYVNWKELFTGLINRGMIPVLSLESNQDEKLFQELGAIVLKEPISNIYSIISHASLVISFGDTVARESSILAVPTYYFGTRDMAVNAEFVSIGIMQVVQGFDDLMLHIQSYNYSNYAKAIERVVNMHEIWDDTTLVILNAVKGHLA